jgi:hypothetical protein
MKKLFAFVTLILLSSTALALDAQKIAAIRAEGHETLWTFLARIPTSFEAQVFYGLMLTGVGGSIASWLWKWAQGVAGAKHYTLRYALGQVLWLAGSAIGAISTMGFSTDDGNFFGWWSVIWFGALAGFGGEVKNERPEWSPEKRAAVQQNEPKG